MELVAREAESVPHRVGVTRLPGLLLIAAHLVNVDLAILCVRVGSVVHRTPGLECLATVSRNDEDEGNTPPQLISPSPDPARFYAGLPLSPGEGNRASRRYDEGTPRSFIEREVPKRDIHTVNNKWTKEKIVCQRTSNNKHSFRKSNTQKRQLSGRTMRTMKNHGNR